MGIAETKTYVSHKERVQTALDRQKPDRCPMQVSFTPEFVERLLLDPRMAGRIERFKAHNPHGGGNLYDIERLMKQDMLLTSVGWANSYYLDKKPYTDEWGVGWESAEYETKFGNGHYTEVRHYPLAEKSAIETYVPPDPHRETLYDEARNLVACHGNEYFIVGATVTTIFETAWALRGLSQTLMDMVEDPDYANLLFDIPYHYHLTAAKKLVEIGVDMIWTGDDVGTQSGMLISPRLWRKFFKPRMAEFIAQLKAINPNLKVAHHSDGNIAQIIPDLIEIGLDVLNPVQPACMNPSEIKAKYGDKLCFWGTIDEQHTLPFGTPDDVRREVKDRLENVAYDGGLVIGPTHHVQLDTPMENFWAMVDTIIQGEKK